MPKTKMCFVKFILINMFLFYVLPCAAPSVFAQPVSSAELINNAASFDKKEIDYAGEVIGEVMKRGEYAWVNVNDKVNAIGVWAGKNLIQEITRAGNYKTIGDIVSVRGIFHRSCIEHGGDLDIHAVSLKKIKDGSHVGEVIDIDRRNIAIGLVGALCLVMILGQSARK